AAVEAARVRGVTRLSVRGRGRRKGDEDEEGNNTPVAEPARQETAKLHAGDPENVALWQQFMPWCLEEIERVYRRLDVHFDHTLGESFYQPRLGEVVNDLLQLGIATESKGAIVVPPEGGLAADENSTPGAEDAPRPKGPPPAMIR